MYKDNKCGGPANSIPPAPLPCIRREVFLRVERTKHITHGLKATFYFGISTGQQRQKSWNCILSYVNLVYFLPKVIRYSEWKRRLLETWLYIAARRCGYCTGDTTCECGQSTETTAHMLQCPSTAQHCTLDDLWKFNNIVKRYIERCKQSSDTMTIWVENI